MNKYRISNRMKILADFVIENRPIADIGTDHGFVPIYLLDENKVSFAVMTDINEGPLEKAANNLKKFDIPTDSYDLRLGDGLKPLKFGEVSSIIIAGMGGENIIDILKEDIIKTKSFERLILQPRKRPWLLRKWLHENGFIIKKESLAFEDPKYCEIILAELKKDNDPADSDDYYLPEKLFDDPLFMDYLADYIRKLKIVIDNMTNSQATSEIIKPWQDRLVTAERIYDEKSSD